MYHPGRRRLLRLQRLQPPPRRRRGSPRVPVRRPPQPKRPPVRRRVYHPARRRLLQLQRLRPPPRRRRGSPCVPEHRPPSKAPRHRPRLRRRPDSLRGRAQCRANSPRWPTPTCASRPRQHNSRRRARSLRREPSNSALERRLQWRPMPQSILGPCRSILINCAMSASRCKWATRPSSGRRTER